MTLPVVLLLAACAPEDAREPVTFQLDLGASACGDVAFALPVARVWLQEAAELARAWPSLIATAQAHPGHDPAGSLIGEAIGPWTLDPCRAGPLGTGEGYRGTVATGMLILQGEALLLGHDGDRPIDLRLVLDHPVPGISLVAPLQARARLSLSFDPATTLSVLPEDTDGDGVLTEADVGATEAATYGLTNPNSWTLTLETP